MGTKPRLAGSRPPRKGHIENLHGTGIANRGGSLMVRDQFQMISGLHGGNHDALVFTLEPGLVVEPAFQQAIVGVAEREQPGSRCAGPRYQVAAKYADRCV